MTQRILPGVAAQLAVLFVEESPAVFRSALRAARDRDEAEDLVQEAFQAAALDWERIALYSAGRRRAWLCRVVANKAVDRYRADRRVRLGDVPVLAGEVPGADDLALTRMAKDRCMNVISGMPDIRRRVAYLKFHEEWENREIAKHLGIAVSTVRVHVRDARVMLEAAVGPDLNLPGGTGSGSDASGEEA